MAISTAVGSERVSRVVGYILTPGFFQESTPNLPQRVVILAEGNTANQANFIDTANYPITSAKAAGDIFGYGSPVHSIMRILRPPTGGGIGGIPTIVYPQLEPGGGVAQTLTITVTGAANGNATHFVRVNGRTSLDGQPYSFVAVDGDAVATIATKIAAAINNILGAPVTAVAALGVVTLTAKWAGVTSAEIDAVIDNQNKPVGLTYVSASATGGAGATDISNAVTQLSGNEWNTLIVNSHNAATFDALELLNGTPDPDTPSGRYTGIIFKPFISVWGSKLSTVAALVAITDVAARLDQVTHALAPAPNSDGFTYEAAANMVGLFARIMQDSPHKDVNGQTYSDMPVPTNENIGEMADYENRDTLSKSGSSTVNLNAGKYEVQDFITTYHPAGEEPPQYRYCRNLMIDFNVRYSYFLLEQINVVDKSIAPSDQPIKVSGVIKPKQWLAIVSKMAEDLAERNIIVEPSFTKDSLDVGISTVNPDRLETFFRYKRSGYVRIASTTGEAGFAFGVR
jgi:phage tail sheath gpL-like